MQVHVYLHCLTETADPVTNLPKQNKCDSKEFDMEESSTLFNPSREELSKKRDLEYFQLQNKQWAK